MSARTEIPAAAVLKKRHRINRIALYMGIALCAVLLVGNILELREAPATIWRAVFAFGPLAIAYLLLRQLPKYSDKMNG